MTERRPAAGDQTRQWSGSAYVHLPAHVDAGTVRAADLVNTAQRRWNGEGRPTLYLACDPAGAISEFARHLEPDGDTGEPPKDDRALLRMDLSLDRVLDLRDPATLAALGVDGAPLRFMDEEVARALSDRLRDDLRPDGLLVPPMAFLDRPERWDLVLFAEDPATLEGAVLATAAWGRLELR